MLDLRQLRYFVVVAEQEHVGRAAKILNITQSPLSRQIIELEINLGIQLFHRSKQRIFLTRAGKNFLTDARALLAHGEKIERQVKFLADGHAGTLVVGYVDGVLHSGILAGALKRLKDKFPEIRIKLKSLRSADQFQALMSGELDIGFTYSKPLSTRKITSEHVHSEQFKLAISKEFDWAGWGSAKKQREMPFIWYQAKNYPSSGKTLFQHCVDAGFYPNIQYEVASPQAALDMVEAGLGFALIQSSLERVKPNSVKYISLPKRFKEMVSIYLVSREEKTPLERTFVTQFNQSQADS